MRIAVVSIAAVLALAAPASAADVKLASGATKDVPRLDGTLQGSEWPGQKLAFPGGSVTARNDGQRLFLLFDVLSDATSSSGDRFDVSIDVDRDGKIDPGLDRRYSLQSNGTLIKQVYTTEGPQQVDGEVLSAASRGFGCFVADGTRFRKGATLGCNRHRVHELAIDFKEIGAAPGRPVRLGFTVKEIGEGVAYEIDYPVGYKNYSEMIEVAPGVAPVISGALQGPRFAGHALEVTQATQTVENGVTLVRDKLTVARVFPRAGVAATSEPVVEVLLHGSRFGVPLAGSPLSMTQTAFANPQRANIDHSADFVLPATWPRSTIELRPAIRTGSTTIYGEAQSFSFTTRQVPTYWSLPVNTRTVSSPKTVAASEIDLQEDRTERIFPVRDVDFVRKSWDAIGALNTSNLDTIIAKLNDYYANAVIAWFFGGIFSGGPPFALPSHIYGQLPLDSGQGGVSDPVWLGGAGVVAAGDRGTSQELTMAHEIDHNLDRRTNSEATWGRHVATPSPKPSHCLNSSGPDPEWPFSNDEKTNEVGFDTRSPFGANTVVPASRPDLMTYCTRSNPSKWIEPYRWHALIDRFALNNTAASLVEGPIDVVPVDGLQVYYLSGVLRANGTGALDPVIRAPGAESDVIQEGDYSLVLRDAQGAVLRAVPFFASFTNVEGVARDQVSFSFRLQADPRVRGIELRRGETLLASRVATPNLPEVALTSPNGGEQIARGSFTVRWNATDADGDALTASLLYSPDGGERWFPLASRVAGTSATVNSNLVPGGSASKLRVVVTDGFHTVWDDSDATFSLARTPPTPTISQPFNGARFAVGSRIEFRGAANDATGAAIDPDSLLWSVDGVPFGEGATPDAVLSAGVHRVTLSAFDESGLEGSSSITVQVGGTCATAGSGDPNSDENGLLSGPVHTAEPLTGPLGGTVHKINCGIVKPLGG